MRELQVGDKIMFIGSRGDKRVKYNATTQGNEYPIIRVRKEPGGNTVYIYRGDDGDAYVWRPFRNGAENDFILVEQMQLLAKGDLIEFAGTESFRGRYLDTSVGTRYEVKRAVHDDNGELTHVFYIDDSEDEVCWIVEGSAEKQYFKIVVNGESVSLDEYRKLQTQNRPLFKDDELSTDNTVTDLYSALDLALATEDFTWAQNLHNQIRQLEGELA